jgi:putative transcriptional regulator
VSEPLAGKLLVASPKLVDPNFARSVVLMCRHGDDGALGLVLNRPIDEAPVSEHLPPWQPYVASPAVVFLGGPVEPTAALALGRVRDGAGHGALTPVTSEVSLIDLNAEPAALQGQLDGVRVFVGYSGWSAGQLEAEITDGGWFVVSSRPEDAFTDDPDELWRRVLRRQGGRLAMFAFAPQDPRTN